VSAPGPMQASSRGSEFVPMLGIEQTLVDIMMDHLEPVHDGDGGAMIVGQEECANQIVQRLREMGIELP